MTWIGIRIAPLEVRLNRGGRRRRRGAGALTVAAVVAAAALPAWAVQAALPSGAAGFLLTTVLAWPLVAAKSLHEHMAAVVRPLAAGELALPRQAVAIIGGRDPDRLDTGGIARGALESLAENATDGVVAPSSGARAWG